MDFHFVHAGTIPNSRKSGRPSLLSVVKRFFPVFMLSAILPFFLMFVVNPPQLGFFTQADAAPVLRVWFEPSKVVSSAGHDVVLKVFASFDSDSLLIPESEFKISSSGQAVLLNDTLSYPKPFKGQVELGEVRVRTLSPGQAFVSISPEDIELKLVDEKVEILPSSATITVR